MITNLEEVRDLTGNHDLRLFRINFNGQRLYINHDPFTYYSGLTGALEAATFKGDNGERSLKTWREKLIEFYSRREVNHFVETTAEFGTLVHEALLFIKENGKIDWSYEADKAEAMFEDQLMKMSIFPDPKFIRDSVFEYCKHVASMLQFVHERVEEIYAIECPVISQGLKIATPVDLVCKCRQTPKGTAEKTVINVKTSNQITPHHLEQVACELVFWNETFPGELCEYSAILRTKEWRDGKAPTFDYKYQDIGQSIELHENASQRLKLCLQHPDSSYYPEPTYRRFTGETNLGEAPEIQVISLQEEWGEIWQKRTEQNEKYE